MNIEIHTPTENLLVNPQDTINFDDGSYFQYFYHKLFKPGIIFPITSFIQNETKRKLFDNEKISVVHSIKLMEQWRNGDFTFSIRTDELKEMINNGWKVGAHSHFHDVVLVIGKNDEKGTWRDSIPLPSFIKKTKVQVGYGSKLVYRGIVDNKIRTIDEYKDFIKEDTEQCLKWFEQKLNFIPIDYCFPFNESNEILCEILKSYGFKFFYGNERIKYNET